MTLVTYILLFYLLNITCIDSESPNHTKSNYHYCVIGAGPSGLQLAYFLNKYNRDYVVFEQNNISGSFFAQYPRKRKLISLNKRHTGEVNQEFNLRHDWHSLLTEEFNDENEPKFTSYSSENFPDANILLKYLNDFRDRFDLNVKYNTTISNLNCISNHDFSISKSKKKTCKSFEVNDQNGIQYNCKILVIASGFNAPNIPKNLENITGYENVSINQTDYEGKSVLILGRGNAAFEIAQSIYGSTNFIHMVSRSRIRNAFSTHYVGDVRALNNELLDTYQLKSLDGFMELDSNDFGFKIIDEKYYLIRLNESNISELSISATRIGYDKVIRCLGFRFDHSKIFSNMMKFSIPKGRLKKYPLIDGSYESLDYENLYYAGTLTHSLDFRKSSGGFIHGFRYTTRSLFRIFQSKFHSLKWPFKSIEHNKIINFIIKRINEASGPYQMFGHLVDVALIKDNHLEYFEEYPILSLNNFGDLTGKELKNFILINYEYGKNYSGPGNDVFNLDRVTSLPKYAYKSNFLHPVIYYFSILPLKNTQNVFEKAEKKHHIIEDFLTLWNKPSEHQLHLRRFLESIFKKDLKKYSVENCLKFHSVYGTYPISCETFFKKLT